MTDRKRTPEQQAAFDAAEAENAKSRPGVETYGDSDETVRTRAQRAMFGAAEAQAQETTDTTLNVQSGTLGQSADLVG